MRPLKRNATEKDQGITKNQLRAAIISVLSLQPVSVNPVILQSVSVNPVILQSVSVDPVILQPVSVDPMILHPVPVDLALQSVAVNVVVVFLRAVLLENALQSVLRPKSEDPPNEGRWAVL